MTTPGERATPHWSIRSSTREGLTHELLDAEGRVVAAAIGANLLDEALDGAALASLAPDGAALIVRTGWLGECHTIDGGERVWTPHPAQWLGDARARFDASVDALLGALDGRPLWLWPHARHVLSDGPSLRRWLEDRGEDAPGVLLEPSALLTEPMLGEAEEHLDRVVQTAEVSRAVRGRVCAVLARGVRAFEGGEPGQVELAACVRSDGLVEADLVDRTARRLAELTGAPIVRPLQ